MTEPTLSERMMRVALLGVVPADDPHVIADAQQEIDYLKIGDNHLQEERAKLEAEIERLRAALNYVADMTWCGADCEWHFKVGYDPQRVLDAITDEQLDQK